MSFVDCLCIIIVQGSLSVHINVCLKVTVESQSIYSLYSFNDFFYQFYANSFFHVFSLDAKTS